MSAVFRVGDNVERIGDYSGDWRKFLEAHPKGPYVVTKCEPFMSKQAIQLNGWTPLSGDTTPFVSSKFRHAEVSKPAQEAGAEYTGGSVDYYKVRISRPTTDGNEPYVAECNDIIEALGMNYAEGNAFKALWRRSAHRTLGLKKKGASDDGLYDAEKVKFFGERLVEQSRTDHA